MPEYFKQVCDNKKWFIMCWIVWVGEWTAILSVLYHGFKANWFLILWWKVIDWEIRVLWKILSFLSTVCQLLIIYKLIQKLFQKSQMLFYFQWQVNDVNIFYKKWLIDNIFINLKQKWQWQNIKWCTQMKYAVKTIKLIKNILKYWKIQHW